MKHTQRAANLKAQAATLKQKNNFIISSMPAVAAMSNLVDELILFNEGMASDMDTVLTIISGGGDMDNGNPGTPNDRQV